MLYSIIQIPLLWDRLCRQGVLFHSSIVLFNIFSDHVDDCMFCNLSPTWERANETLFFVTEGDPLNIFGNNLVSTQGSLLSAQQFFAGGLVWIVLVAFDILGRRPQTPL